MENDDDDDDTVTAVQVAVRVRPFSEDEIAVWNDSQNARKGKGASDGGSVSFSGHGWRRKRSRDLLPNMVVEMDEGQRMTTLIDPSWFDRREEMDENTAEETEHVWKTKFVFDYSFWSAVPSSSFFASQADVFGALGKPLVRQALAGFNCSIFAYGQTGSGKTYTMIGDGQGDHAGLIPRFCREIFAQLQEGVDCSTIASFSVTISYLEIYLERVRDLFGENDGTYLRVREHPKHGAYAEGLSHHDVESYEDIEQLLAIGNTSRTTASTKMNNVSSRSHAVFTMYLRTESAGNAIARESKIDMVDLAGSERQFATGASGGRLKEASNINKSLSALSEVIKALAARSDAGQGGDGESNGSDGSGGGMFIPFRNSTLTWLLRDSLGGNAKTVMLATVSPAELNYEESLSTLRYVERAKRIVGKVTANEDMTSAQRIAMLEAEVEELRGQLAASSAGASVREKMNEQPVEFREQLARMRDARERERRSASAKYDNMARENAELIEKVRSMEDLMRDLKAQHMAEMEARKSEKSALLLRIAKLREENETVKSMLSGMGKDVAQLHGMIDHAVEEGGRHKEKLRALADAMELLQHEKQKLQEDLARNAEAYNAELASLRSNADETGAKEAALRNEVSQLQVQLEESKRVASASIEESKGLQASLAENAEVHSAEVASLRVEIEGQKVTEATLREEITLLQSQLEESRLMATRRSKDEERLRGEMEMQADSRQREKLQALADAMELLQHEKQKLQEDLARNAEAYNAELASLRSNADETGAKEAALRNEVSQLQVQLEESKRVASASIEESKGLQASLAENAEVHSAEVASLRVEIEGQKVTEATLREEITLLQSQLEESRLMATRRSEDVEGLQENIKVLRHQLDLQEVMLAKAQDEAATALSRKASGSLSGKSEGEGGSGPTINDLRRELAEKDAVHEEEIALLEDRLLKAQMQAATAYNAQVADARGDTDKSWIDRVTAKAQLSIAKYTGSAATEL
eukprot:g1955.t1